MKKTASSLTVALLLAAASASAFAQEQPATTPTFPQNISLKALRGFTTGQEPVFEALGIESTTAAETTEIYLTADGTQNGGQLDITNKNLYFGGDGKVVVKGANVKNDAAVNETYNRTATAFAFVVAGGEVVFDDVDAGNIKQNLSVGTAYSEGGTATLTIQNGAQLETTAFYNTVGANGTEGVVNVTGTGSVLKTQQITLGAGTSGLTAFSGATYGENNGKLYWTPKYLATDEQYEDAKARAADATGTINISGGAKMYVGEGNADRSNNKLQIFNGAVNVDGSGSELILGNNCYLTMDPSYGTLPNGASGQEFHFNNAISVTDGGKVRVADGGKLYNFTAGVLYGERYNVKTDITVSGAGSEFSAETNGNVLLGGAQAALYGITTSDGVSEVNVSVTDGATAKISGETVDIGWDSSGGNSAKVEVDIAASGEGSSLEIEATNGNIFLNYRGDVTSALSAENGATLSLVSLGASGSGWISVGDGATITAEGGTLETTATSGVLLESGAKLVLGDDAVWTASGDVTLKSGAEMTVSIATTGNAAADITFSNSAQLAFKDGAVLNLTLGENETLAVLQDKSRIYLGDIFEGAALSVGNDMKVGILASDGVTELGRYDVQKDDGKVFIVIPEPSAFGLLAGAFALVCAASRRRRK